MKNEIRELLKAAGADHVGFAKAEPVDTDCTKQFCNWLDNNRHAAMYYMKNHQQLRQDPRLLLPDAKTVISLAFNYYPPRLRSSDKPYIALYAYGADYHDVIRNLLSPACQTIALRYDAQTRICIDSAPIHERYWAWKAGLGFQGLNGTFIIPSKGSYFFLAEILTTLEIEPDTPLTSNCGNCGACLNACPAGALNADKTLDARRCLSYLTIECRQDWTPPCPAESLPLFGCDCCQKACPHNAVPQPTTIEPFFPSQELLDFGIESADNISDSEFRRIFRKSPVKRTKPDGLCRNASKLKK